MAMIEQAHHWLIWLNENVLFLGFFSIQNSKNILFYGAKIDIFSEFSLHLVGKIYSL